ncbi:MAG: hypothetical protein FWE22_03870 [Firmicutes bacterium]|nr:hypothetical protein [Bacillota bacterium]
MENKITNKKPINKGIAIASFVLGVVAFLVSVFISIYSIFYVNRFDPSGLPNISVLRIWVFPFSPFLYAMGIVGLIFGINQTTREAEKILYKIMAILGIIFSALFLLIFSYTMVGLLHGACANSCVMVL